MRRFWTILLGLLFCGPFCRGEILLDAQGRPVRYAGRYSANRINLPPYRPSEREFRGVWVATVENIDFGPFRTVAEFKSAARTLLNQLKALGFNAVLFQVRSNCDAWYPSQFAPYSKFLAGREGVGLPGADPLAFLIAEAHARGMEFHAWLNPYRVVGRTPMGKNSYLATLAPQNFARRNPSLVLDVRNSKEHSLLLNPGEPAVIRHIQQVVREIAARYPVDGIHFDDYFYLYQDIGNADAAAFRRYNNRGLTLPQWRRQNVTQVIRGVHEEMVRLRQQGRRIRFGVSPFGIWANREHIAVGSLTGGKESYFVQHADTRGWVKAGYLDYIAPQLYWPFTHETAAYAALVDWWSDTVQGTNTRLYIGQGFYQMGKSGWRANEIVNQLRYNQTRREVSGTIFFSARHLLRPDNAVKRSAVERLRRLWHR